MQRVLLLFPTAWDRKWLAKRGRGSADQFELVPVEPSDEECPAKLDVDDYVDRIAGEHRGRADGVMSSSDYPGPVFVALVARALGLRGTLPREAVRCSHKFYARAAQRAAAPHVTPRFELIDPRAPRAPSFGFPCFVKPVKGSFSRFARRVANEDELRQHLLQPGVHEYLDGYLSIFNDVVARYGEVEHDGHWFIAEEVLAGAQVTLEGTVVRGDVEVLGIVDTAIHGEHASFARFDYPSRVPAPVQARMRDVAERVVRTLGLDATAFNVEFFYDAASDRIAIIEVNPRVCGQFGDLYAKVDGIHGYEVALAAACGMRPELRRRGGSYACAASVPLRRFDDVRVARAPSDADLRAAEALFPGTLVWNEVREGQELGPLRAQEDGVSVRYAVLDVGGESPEDLERRIEVVRKRLDYRFVPSARARDDSGAASAELPAT